MAALLTDQEFAGQFAGFRCAFRLEARSSYRLGYEQAAFDRFRAGTPLPPEEVWWWRRWLARVWVWTQEQDRTITRVRLDDTPRTAYQEWLRWCEPWHLEAGDQILHLPRPAAASLGVPSYDFWLFDDDRLILMLFDPAGTLTGKLLITDADAPEVVAQHCAWRDLAVRNATPAAVAAA